MISNNRPVKLTKTEIVVAVVRVEYSVYIWIRITLCVGVQVLDKYNPPDDFLPESYTCFFLLKMPRYSCREVLRQKLKYAIHFCKSIDTDDYARIALTSYDGEVAEAMVTDESDTSDHASNSDGEIISSDD